MGARSLLNRLIAAGEDHQKAPQRAVRLPSLRPFLPRRHHLRRTLRGLPVLAAMAWRAGRTGLRMATAPPKPKQQPKATEEKPQPTKGGEKKDDQKSAAADALERAGAALLVVVIACTAAVGAAGPLWAQVQPYARTAVGVATVALLTAAWIVGPKEPGEPEPPAAGGEAEPDPAPLPQDAEPLDIDLVAAAVRQLASPQGWKGAHLDDVLALLPGRSRAELLEVLAEAGIPVTEQLKLTLPGGRQRNRQGIRLAHLPPAPEQPGPEAAPGPPPAAAVEVAPEPAPRAAPVTVYGLE